VSLEQYFFEGQDVVRELSFNGETWRSAVENLAEPRSEASSAWWQSFLRGATVRPVLTAGMPPVLRSIDAFSGCGGLTLGAAQAALAVGCRLESVAAIDGDMGSLEVHQANFGTKCILQSNASSLVDFHVSGMGVRSRFAYSPELLHSSLASEVGKINLFLAGPPCQGHSNLNNRTRREDPRNLLYLTAVALAVALKAKFVAIENVPEVVADKDGVVGTAKALFKSAGYEFLDSGMLSTHALGGAQTRKRFFLIAALGGPPEGGLTIKSVAAGLKRPAHSLGWAIGDLLSSSKVGSNVSIMDSVPALSQENRVRIDHLFDHDLYELPDEVRPDCHKNGHTYPAVYGRLSWDKPAQTITTGFLTPGRGRYIHPLRRRVITPREAARLQSFPDSFRWIVNGHDPARNALTKWIGDAVPPLLGYAAVLPLVTRL
jgi:DNA (cytosine-5)-methyltransferase 1